MDIIGMETIYAVPPPGLSMKSCLTKANLNLKTVPKMPKYFGSVWSDLQNQKQNLNHFIYSQREILIIAKPLSGRKKSREKTFQDQ